MLPKTLRTKRPLERGFYKVVAEHALPYMTMTLDSNNKWHGSSSMYKFLEFLSEALNFDYELIRSPDRKWGSKQPNGSFTGMFGVMQRKEADILLGPAFINNERSEVAKFTAVVHMLPVKLVTSKFKDEIDQMGFIRAFDVWTWFLMFLSIMVLSVFLYGFSKMEGYLPLRQKVTTFNEKFSMVFAIFLQEAYIHEIEGNITRPLIALWILTTLILSKSYAGILIALMTIPMPNAPINSIEDLVSQSEIPWRLREGSNTHTFFRKSTSEAGKAVFAGSSGTHRNCQTNWLELANGEYAAFCSMTYAKKAIVEDLRHTKECHIYVTTPVVYYGVMALAASFEFEEFHELNTWVMRYVEGGFLSHLLELALFKAEKCLHVENQIDRWAASLTLEHFYGTFYLLFTGYALSTIVFLIELCNFKRKNYLEKQKNIKLSPVLKILNKDSEWKEVDLNEEEQIDIED